MGNIRAKNVELEQSNRKLQEEVYSLNVQLESASSENLEKINFLETSHKSLLDEINGKKNEINNLSETIR